MRSEGIDRIKFDRGSNVGAHAVEIDHVHSPLRGVQHPRDAAFEARIVPQGYGGVRGEAPCLVARGHAAIRALRDGSSSLHDAPILLAVTLPRLTALDYAIGLSDFILMPLVRAELYGRIRRLDWQSSAFDSDEVIKIDDLVIDIAGREARLAGRRIELTRQEFELLRCLAQHRGRVFTRAALLARAWDYRGSAATRTVDIHVRRVRSKLGTASAVIETVRNVGYKLRA